jgi:hypothetical protein
MNRRRLLIGSAIGCGVLLVVGILVMVAAVIGANIGMQKAKDQATTVSDGGVTTNSPSLEPKKKKAPEYIPVTLRVSGEQGTRYRCTYSTFTPEGRWDEVQEGTLATSPVDYRAQAVIDHPEEHGTIIAGCSRAGDSKGRLKLELLAKGKVVDSDEAERGLPDTKYKKHADSGAVSVNYDPRCGGPIPKSGPCK